jgi:deoxyadenosine/deoxycytidine kinase
MGKLIAIVGTTGAGKTSLLRALSAAGKFATGLEQHAERPFQALFKQDRRYALANQLDYLLLRAEQERELRENAAPGLIDGGLDLDFHGFTRLFHARGLLDAPEFDLCRRFYEFTRLALPLPDRIIYLDAPASIIRKRLARRSRINIARVEDVAQLDEYIRGWLVSLPPERILRLDVAHAPPDYHAEAAWLLEKL